MLPLKTILHPTDFSELSHSAFPLACALARDYGAALLVVHVVLPPQFHGEVVARRQEDGFYEVLWEQLRGLQAPGVTVEYFLREGDAAAEILRLAGERQCDLIVMGTHGRSGLGRLLMGSVAEAVVRQAPCLVLTVKTPPPSEDRGPRSEEGGSRVEGGAPAPGGSKG